MPTILHSTARATAPYRVRIALNLKGVAYDYAPVDLVGGQQHKAEYRAVNAQRLTPTLQLDDGTILTQSLAILEWLEETHPEPPLLPRDPAERAAVRAMADVIACDMHPLNNLRVMRALSAMGVSPPARQTWTERWISDGFAALEPRVAALGRGWAFGDAPTFADCCLIPQVYSAERNSVSLDGFPAIRAVGVRAAEHPAFAAAHPDQQPDAPAP